MGNPFVRSTIILIHRQTQWRKFLCIFFGSLNRFLFLLCRFLLVPPKESKEKAFFVWVCEKLIKILHIKAFPRTQAQIGLLRLFKEGL